MAEGQRERDRQGQRVAEGERERDRQGQRVAEEERQINRNRQRKERQKKGGEEECDSKEIEMQMEERGR